MSFLRRDKSKLSLAPNAAGQQENLGDARPESRIKERERKEFERRASEASERSQRSQRSQASQASEIERSGEVRSDGDRFGLEKTDSGDYTTKSDSQNVYGAAGDARLRQLSEYGSPGSSSSICGGQNDHKDGIYAGGKNGGKNGSRAALAGQKSPPARRRVPAPLRAATFGGTDPEPLPTNTQFGTSAPHRAIHRAQSALALVLPSSSLLDSAPASERPLLSRAATEGFLPRLSVVENVDDDHVLREDYRGFHRAKGGVFGNVPPLTTPIKPRFHKKGPGLLGKLMHGRKEEEDEQLSVAMLPQAMRRSTGKHKFRLPSISQPQEGKDRGDRGSEYGRDKGDRTGDSGRDPRSETGGKNSISSFAGSLAGSVAPSMRGSGAGSFSGFAPGSAPGSFAGSFAASFMGPVIAASAQAAASAEASAGNGDKAGDSWSGPSGASGPGNQGGTALGHSVSVSGPSTTPQFDLNVNVDEMLLILKNPSRSTRPLVSASAGTTTPEVTDDDHKHSAWKAPDSWDVTEETPISSAAAALAAAVAANDIDSDSERAPETAQTGDTQPSPVQAVLSPEESEEARKRAEISERPTDVQFPVRNLPVLFGTVSSRIRPGVGTKLAKGANHIVRVFKEDNTFTTILCAVETTTAELLTIVQRKFFFDSILNYQISLFMGSKVKVLEPFEKPLKIQLGLLTLSGYTDRDNLRIIGREDMSFVCKLVVENMFLRNLTHEEESLLSKDYVDVNISGLDLKTIPIIFHQHTYEIEKLNVANNPSIYIPLDFIQLCTNLATINFARNGCSKFPVNFLHATSLTNLNMEANFLDELPARISHLQHLQTLKLNSNQLYFLPKSFGKLLNLTDLNLSSNYFQEYPECVNDLTGLQHLNLSYNDLSSIPDSISKLTRLSKLNLSTNKLSKSLPACFKMLTNLKRLDIRYNRISNVDVLGSLPNLEVVYASKNNISGFSDKMESLRLLHFDRNPITSLEFEIMLPMLTVLDLSKAKITAIPSEFISKIPHIEKLVLDKNHLVTLPSELGGLPKLTHLSLYGNNIQHLPDTIGQLTSLQYLDLHSNNIESLPSDIWNLKNLSTLNVSSNILSSFPKPSFAIARKISSTQSLPAKAINSLEQANEMSASAIRNSPVSLADSLLSLTISDNRLSDDCFESIAFLVNLKLLNVSYNDILEIPEGAIGRLATLNELYLSGNSLTKLPAEDFENLTELRLLYMNNNKLPTLPSELSKLKNLEHLDVGSNQLRYNISNWPYDWNWHWNQKLKYLNFSGNKRFEIKQSYLKNPDTGVDFDSLLVLKDLRVLGLIDVTLTTPAVPDLSMDVRVRTTSSELDNVGYGVSDCMGIRDYVSFRDMFIQKFRGNENEVLVCSFDGHMMHSQNNGHLISYLSKQLFLTSFTNELDKTNADDDVENAMRRAFLSLNKDINSVLAAKKSGGVQNTNIPPELAKLSLAEDAMTGCAMSVLYLKGNTLYCGNLGDIEVVCAKTNGEYRLLTTKHDPTSRPEFERIRASGGYVSGDGALDGTLTISRGVGFFDYIPHTHSGPSTSTIQLSGADDMIVMGSKILWDYVSYDLAVDILRQEKNDPMVAAQKLRDYAICYGATDKISVTVICVGDQKKKRSMYSNLGREVDLFANKKRRDRFGPSGDTALRRLDDEIDPPVGELALVFTDIKNSTLLWDTYPVAMRSAIKLHNTIMRRQLRIVGGYEVKTEGDSFMVSFPTPSSALLWCFNIQNQLLNEDWPSEILETNECCEVTDNAGNMIFRGLSVRMGIHWGSPVCELDMVTRRMDYFGPMVNRASRIESSADGGQIAVSSDFLAEIELLYSIHKQVQSGQLTLEVAYEGNVHVGEIIEKELESLNAMGCSYYELGERKLKGLETPEMITLVFPKNLDIRYEIFKKRTSQSQEMPGRIIGMLPVAAVYQLRTISLRLENVCSILNSGISNDEQFLRFSSDTILKSVGTRFQEKDIVSLFNHIVTRVENCVALIELRQAFARLQGGTSPSDLAQSKAMWTLMDEVNKIFSDFAKVTQGQ